MNQFIETKRMFMDATAPCTYPLTYEQWMVLRDDLKAAALYVNFFDQISLAWYRAKSEFVDEEDGVSTVMQYLIKNVKIIEDDSNKYNEKYIYRVAYNSMGCLRRVKYDKTRYDMNISQYAVINDEEVDLFATMIGDTPDLVEQIVTDQIWSLINHMDEDSKTVIDCLLQKKRIVGDMAKKKKRIMKDLQTEFYPFRSMYSSDKPTRFSQVLSIDDSVQSAVVEMPDGARAVYYGEKTSSRKRKFVVFFGAEKDYTISISDAEDLIVIDIELYN